MTTLTLDQQRLVEANLQLARKISLHFKGRLPTQVALEDLEADALYGLTLAARRFDPSNGATFATYANRVIRGRILRGIRQRLDVVPEGLKSVSVHGQPERDMGSQGLANSIEAPGASPERAVDTKDQVEHLMRHLKPHLKEVAAGFLRGLTRDQIADELGLHRDSVSARMRSIRRVARQLGISDD